MNRKFEHYNTIKFLATILVVLGHSSRMYTGKGVIYPLNESNLLKEVTRIIYIFHMPLYIGVTGMIYGACVDDLKKYKDTKIFVLSKIKRLLIPYLFWGFFLVAPVMCIFKFTELSFGEYCIKGILLAKDTRHLWYIVVLFEMYLLCAIFRKYLFKINFFIVTSVLIFVSLMAGKISMGRPSENSVNLSFQT